MKLTALAVFVLVLGIVLGLALRGGTFEAEAKPPPPAPSPTEFTHIHAKLCSQGFCELGGAVVVKDVSAELTSLSSQGWELVSVESSGSAGIGEPRVLFTLSRAVP